LPNELFVEPQIGPGDNPVPDIAGDVLQNPGLLPHQPLRNWHRHRVNAELTIWSKHPSALHPHGLHVVEVGLIRRPRRHLAVVDNRVPVRRRGDDQVDRLRGPARHDFGSVAADDLVEGRGGRVTSPLGPVPAHPFGGRHHSKSEARSPCVRHAGHVTKGDFRFKTRPSASRLAPPR